MGQGASWDRQDLISRAVAGMYLWQRVATLIGNVTLSPRGSSGTPDAGPSLIVKGLGC